MRNKLNKRTKNIILGSLVAAVIASLAFAGGHALASSQKSSVLDSPAVAASEHSDGSDFKFVYCAIENEDGSVSYESFVPREIAEGNVPGDDYNEILERAEAAGCEDRIFHFLDRERFDEVIAASESEGIGNCSGSLCPRTAIWKLETVVPNVEGNSGSLDVEETVVPCFDENDNLVGLARTQELCAYVIAAPPAPGSSPEEPSTGSVGPSTRIEPLYACIYNDVALGTVSAPEDCEELFAKESI